MLAILFCHVSFHFDSLLLLLSFEIILLQMHNMQPNITVGLIIMFLFICCRCCYYYYFFLCSFSCWGVLLVSTCVLFCNKHLISNILCDDPAVFIINLTLLCCLAFCVVLFQWCSTNIKSWEIFCCYFHGLSW